MIAAAAGGIAITIMGLVLPQAPASALMALLSPFRVIPCQPIIAALVDMIVLVMIRMRFVLHRRSVSALMARRFQE